MVAGEDAVYVGRPVDSDHVGSIVNTLARSPRTAALTDVHPTSNRPWGTVTAISEGDRFAVKRLKVSPRKKTSLQNHLYRAEHWIVVCGTAEVTMAGAT